MISVVYAWKVVRSTSTVLIKVVHSLLNLTVGTAVSPVVLEVFLLREVAFSGQIVVFPGLLCPKKKTQKIMERRLKKFPPLPTM